MGSELEILSGKQTFYSRILGRKLVFIWSAPQNYKDLVLPVLLMNDGQDYAAMSLAKILYSAFHDPGIRPFLYIGIETNRQRIQDYGVSSGADFKGRGANAGKYSQFILKEFIPFLKKEFKLSSETEDWVYFGMSLGGLSAFDIVYTHPEQFGKAAVFSGSFWWRNRAYQRNDMADRSRMILDIIKRGTYHPHLAFWLQCGTADETADRNKNGIIDSIEDTQDVIRELQEKGYSFPGDITYVEIQGGKHDPGTWASVFPATIRWAFGKTAY